MLSTSISVDFQKRKKSEKYIFQPNVYVEQKPKSLARVQKLDAVRRCIRGYACNFTAKEKLKHLVSKEALNIDGLGKKVIEQLWDLNILKEPSNIFNLDYKKIEKLEGWGKLSINNLKNAINKSLKINLDRLIYSIGIRHIGHENAKTIASFLDQLINLKRF